MKKTYVLTVDFDADSEGIVETYGATLDVLKEFIEEAAQPTLDIMSKRSDAAMPSKVDDMMCMLEAWADRPELGAIILTLATFQLARSIESHAMGPGSIKRLLEDIRNHNCEHCSAYDKCSLEIKKPREPR